MALHQGPVKRAASALRPVQPLTPRELEILRWMSRGATNRQIAAALLRSEFTVSNHVRAIMRKLQVSNRTTAVVQALRMGVLTELEPRLDR